MDNSLNPSSFHYSGACIARQSRPGTTPTPARARNSRRNPPTTTTRWIEEPEYYYYDPAAGASEWGDSDDPADAVDTSLRWQEDSSSRRRDGGTSLEDDFVRGSSKLSRAATRSRSNKNKRTAKRRRGSASRELGEDPGTEAVQPSSFRLAVPGSSAAKRPSVGSQGTQGHGPGPFVASDHGHEVDDSFFLHDGRATAVPQNNLLPPVRIKSPELVDLKRSSNYLAMDSRSSTPPVPSMSSYISRLHQFFSDLKSLPWTSSRPTADYYPGQSRGRYQTDQDFEKDWDAPSWYALLHRQYIDLLSSESSGTASLPPNSAIEYQPTLAYGAPTGEGQAYYAFSQDHSHPVYPYGYVPQPFIIEPQNGRHAQSNSFHIYGPPVPGHLSSNQYPYPTWHWQPPPRTS